MYGIAVRGSKSWATIHPGFMTMYSRFGLKDFTVADGKLNPQMNTADAVTFTKKWADMVKAAGPASWPTYSWYNCSGDLGALTLSSCCQVCQGCAGLRHDHGFSEEADDVLPACTRTGAIRICLPNRSLLSGQIGGKHI